MIKILNSGIHSSIQDRGRWGYQRFGMVVSGAMDVNALVIGNLLVMNSAYEAAIEITIGLTEIQFDSDRLIAITGADTYPLLNNKRAPLWRPFIVKKGDRLKFQVAERGARSYMFCAGGFELPIILNSKSTYEKGHMGGFEGRALKKHDSILLNSMNDKQFNVFKALSNLKSHVNWSVNYKDFCDFKSINSVSVLKSCQSHLFQNESITNFEHNLYTVSTRSDRMGCHLECVQQLELANPADILSEAVSFGTIQVPPSGKPMILLADRQTTGGYPKIGQVIQADFSTLAQMKPGDQLHFKFVDMKEAESRILHQLSALKQIQYAISDKLNQL